MNLLRGILETTVVRGNTKYLSWRGTYYKYTAKGREEITEEEYYLSVSRSPKRTKEKDGSVKPKDGEVVDTRNTYVSDFNAKSRSGKIKEILGGSREVDEEEYDSLLEGYKRALEVAGDVRPAKRSQPQQYERTVGRRGPDIEEELSKVVEEEKVSLVLEALDWNFNKFLEKHGTPKVYQEALDEYIYRAPAYDTEQGPMYRGYGVTSEEDKVREMLDSLKPGDTINQGRVASWTSRKETAYDFAQESKESATSVTYVCTKNRTSVPVKYYSSFGRREDEVLSASDTEWVVSKVESKDKKKYWLGGWRTSKSYTVYMVEKEKENKYGDARTEEIPGLNDSVAPEEWEKTGWSEKAKLKHTEGVPREQLIKDYDTERVAESLPEAKRKGNSFYIGDLEMKVDLSGRQDSRLFIKSKEGLEERDYWLPGGLADKRDFRDQIIKNMKKYRKDVGDKSLNLGLPKPKPSPYGVIKERKPVKYRAIHNQVKNSKFMNNRSEENLSAENLDILKSGSFKAFASGRNTIKIGSLHNGEILSAEYRITDGNLYKDASTTSPKLMAKGIKTKEDLMRELKNQAIEEGISRKELWEYLGLSKEAYVGF